MSLVGVVFSVAVYGGTERERGTSVFGDRGE